MATINWPTTQDAAPKSNWRNDTSHSDGTTDGSDAAEGTHALEHNKLALFMAAAELEMGNNPSGTFVDMAARLAARTTCRKTADQTLSSVTALTNITDMVLPISTTGLDYAFKVILICTSSAGATNGIRVGLTCPALTGYVSAKVTIPRTIDPNPAAGTGQATMTVTNSPWEGYITSSGDSVVADIVPVGINFPVIIEGILSNPSATGSIQIQAANEVTTASGNVVKRGSFGDMYIN